MRANFIFLRWDCSNQFHIFLFLFSDVLFYYLIFWLLTAPKIICYRFPYWCFLFSSRYFLFLKFFSLNLPIAFCLFGDFMLTRILFKWGIERFFYSVQSLIWLICFHFPVIVWIVWFYFLNSEAFYFLHYSKCLRYPAHLDLSCIQRFSLSLFLFGFLVNFILATSFQKFLYSDSIFFTCYLIVGSATLSRMSWSKPRILSLYSKCLKSGSAVEKSNSLLLGSK